VKYLISFLLLLLISLPAIAETELKGYYKNILYADKDNILLTNRLRLKFLTNITSNLKADIEYTNQLGAGKTTFSPVANNKSFFDLSSKLIKQNDLSWEHSFYRAFVSYSISNLDFVIGRQRIAWGTGRFWNPTDILNPFDPLDIESGERSGIDAINLKINTSHLSYLNFIYAPAKEVENSILTTKYHTTIGYNDFSLIFGKFKQDMVIGADYAGSFMGAGIRSEFAYTLAKFEESYWKFVLSSDYSFYRLYILGEYYHNGQGSNNKALYDINRLVLGEIMSLAKNYFALLMSYDVTPLLKFNVQTIYNIDDMSFYLSPTISYSVSSNIEFVTGLSKFQGDIGTEYGRNTTLFFSLLQWSF